MNDTWIVVGVFASLDINGRNLYLADLGDDVEVAAVRVELVMVKIRQGNVKVAKVRVRVRCWVLVKARTLIQLPASLNSKCMFLFLFLRSVTSSGALT